MYNAKFIKDNGEVFVLGPDNNIVFDVAEGLSGINVDLGTTQSFSQIGENVDTQSVSGQRLTIKGVIYRDITNTKKRLLNVFAPFTSGKLVFDDKYYIYVYVKNSPTVAPQKNSGAFMFKLFATFPFFKELEEHTYIIGSVIPMFSFPVNYGTEHSFGWRSTTKYVNVINNGDLKAIFKVDLTTEATSENITLTNLETFKFLKLNGTLNAGEKISIYRDEKNQLKAILTNSSAEETDIISWIDDESSLYELNVGDNLMLATDENGGKNLTAQITFNSVVGGVYES